MLVSSRKKYYERQPEPHTAIEQGADSKNESNQTTSNEHSNK